MTIALENCPWIICLGSHVADGNITMELHMDQIDELSSRRLDWLVVNNKSPQIQLYVNVRNKPNHCLLLLHNGFISDPVKYIETSELPYETIDSKRGSKREWREILIENVDWETWRENLVGLLTATASNEIDLPILIEGALEEAKLLALPWLQDVTQEDDHCRLFLVPDYCTYILEPNTRIWGELVGGTICFTGQSPGQEWETGRVFKYMVSEEDIGHCAYEMDFVFDCDGLGEDYISRRAYRSSSSSSSASSDSDSSPAPSASAPCPDKVAVAKEDPYQSVDSIPSAEDFVETAEDSAPSNKKLRQTVMRVPPLTIPPQTPREIRRADPTPRDDDERPTKMRAVLVEIHFLFGHNVKFLYNEKGELRIHEIEQKVGAFLETQGLLGDVFSYSFRRQLEKNGPINTAVLELKVGHDKLGVMRHLSYDDLRLYNFKGQYKTHHDTREVYE